MLGQYGVKSRHSPDKAHRGYHRADLEDPWQRYLPPVPARKASEPSEASGLKPCAGCGQPMTADIFGDGRHPGCKA
jgi:hypothetical protein